MCTSEQEVGPQLPYVHMLLTGAQFMHQSAVGGPMVLNNLECTGTEESILDCPLGLTTTCDRAETAGVRCLPKTGTYNQQMHGGITKFTVQKHFLFSDLCLYTWSNHYIQAALMGAFDWLAVPTLLKVLWRCATMEYGVQCAVTYGQQQMLQLYADSWDIQVQVTTENFAC